jgi:hypothetical protein
MSNATIPPKTVFIKRQGFSVTKHERNLGSSVAVRLCATLNISPLRSAPTIRNPCG